EAQVDPGRDARWPGRTVSDVDLGIGTVSPPGSTGRGIRGAVPARRTAGLEGIHRSLPGAGRGDLRAVPGDGPGRAGRGRPTGRGGEGDRGFPDREFPPGPDRRLLDPPRD